MTRNPQQLAKDLQERIYAGEIEPSATMPAEAALAAELGVDRQTVRSAYTWLRDNNLIVSRGSRGWIVVDPSGLDRLRRTVIRKDERGLYLESRRYNRATGEWDVERNVLITDERYPRITPVPAPPHVAMHLGVPAGQLVIERARVLGLAATASTSTIRRLISRTYITDEMVQFAPQVRQVETGPGGILARFEDAAGGPVRLKNFVRSGRLNVENAQALSVTRGSPGLQILQPAYLPDGRVACVLDQWAPGEMYEIEMDLERHKSAEWMAER